MKKVESLEVNVALALEKYSGMRSMLMSGELFESCASMYYFFFLGTSIFPVWV